MADVSLDDAAELLTTQIKRIGGGEPVTVVAADDRVAPLVQGDPVRIGALRLDFATEDVTYRQRLYEAFYGDVDPALASAATGLLTPDGPIGIMLGTTTLTQDGWGSVRRTYLTCAKDMAIRLALQEKFIAEADAAFPDNPTSVVALDASHSPFLSMPEKVADIITTLG